MSVLFTQHWDVEPDKDNDYSNFIMGEYSPGMERLGVRLVGGYYVTVGMGPRIIGVTAADDLNKLNGALASDGYQALTARLMEFVKNYTSRILIPTGRVPVTEVRLQTGIWKFNQYWNILPGREEAYTGFIRAEYLPAMEALRIPVTGGWRVIVGAGPYIVSESSAASIVDIAKAIEHPECRKALKTLKSKYVTDYHSRILAPTGRIDIPFFMREVMKGF